MNAKYRLEKIPSKVENFIKRLDKKTQSQIQEAFDYIIESPFWHENPTVIKIFRGKKKGVYRYRLGNIRFIYQVDKEERSIKVLQMDNRGDIY